MEWKDTIRNSFYYNYNYYYYFNFQVVVVALTVEEVPDS